MLSLTAVLFQCMRRWWLGRTSGDLLTSCRASLTAGITPWPGDHHTIIIIIIIIIITDLCSSRRVQEMWERSQRCRCHFGGGDVWNKKILTGIYYQLVSPVGVNLVTKVGPVGPPVVLGLSVPPGLGGDGGHQDHQPDDISDGDDHPESLRSLDTGHWTHSCLVAWRGEQLQNVSKLFRVQS